MPGPRTRSKWLVPGLLALLLLDAGNAAAQLLVLPRRPGKSNVRYFPFEWSHVDITVYGMPEVGTSTPGVVRLFFYEREKAVAERAAAMIEAEYKRLTGVFQYVPTRPFPYVLYSSYHEFLETNLFPIQEGVLGVTDPRGLDLTLPYFGDHALFRHVSSHEMTHQFTIQRLRSLQDEVDARGEIIRRFPLWFIEGIAELYSHKEIDPETEIHVRDLVTNPDIEHGYGFLDFFDDQPGSGLWTYQVGVMRCLFLEEEFGADTVQRIIAESPLLVGKYMGLEPVDSFAKLVEKVTGETPPTLTQHFDTWIKQRAFRSWLSSSQRLKEYEVVPEGDGPIIDLATSPDGSLMLVSTIDFETSSTRLILTDPRQPDARKTLADDGGPGLESLHPVLGRSFALSSSVAVYVAESRGHDVIYFHPFTRTASLTEDKTTKKKAWKIDLDREARRGYSLSERGLVAAYSPAIAPDGKRAAFVGLAYDGTRDIYVITPSSVEGVYDLERLTNDLYAERQVAWGAMGVVYTADATADGHYNLFRVDPDHPGTPERLTAEPRDHRDPVVLPDGTIAIVTFDAGHGNVYKVYPDRLVRWTDVATGITDLGLAKDGDMWGLLQRGGRRRVVRIPDERFTGDRVFPTPAVGLTLDETPHEITSRTLAGAEPYDFLRISNWQLGGILAFLGAGPGGIYGRVLFAAYDRLRDHTVLLNVAIFGRPDLIDGYALYVDERGRVRWGFGPIQTLRFRSDRSVKGFEDFFTSGERFTGALISARYPFDRFTYAQADLAIGGATSFIEDVDRILLASLTVMNPGRNLVGEWEEANRGVRLQTELTLRLGYDTIHYNYKTGPVTGSALILEPALTVQPADGLVYGRVRVDAERYIHLGASANLLLRALGGVTVGKEAREAFYLSSFDTLRGVDISNRKYLLGQHFWFTSAELQVPLDPIIRTIFFTSLEGVLAVDMGAAAEKLEELWDRRVLDIVAGFNFGLGPLTLRLHFAIPIDTGAPPEKSPPLESWVTNFSLAWTYF